MLGLAQVCTREKLNEPSLGLHSRQEEDWILQFFQQIEVWYLLSWRHLLPEPWQRGMYRRFRGPECEHCYHDAVHAFLA
jgi:hypothetical protein